MIEIIFKVGYLWTLKKNSARIPKSYDAIRNLRWKDSVSDISQTCIR